MSRIGDAARVMFKSSGYQAVPTERLAEAHEEQMELSAVRAELDMLGWTVLDSFSGSGSQELSPDQRRAWARKAKVAWFSDALIGAAVDLKNDFVFGRGVSKPRASDPKVQEILDEFYDDPDNQRVLTSYEAQLALGTSVELQSNVFYLLFDEGEDGKIKLGLLNHDEVVTAVPDPDFRQRVLYYVAKHRRQEWDFKNDRLKIDVSQAVEAKVKYYRHWQLDVEEEGERDLPRPPASKLGEGKVYHLRVNRDQEMIFGAPSYQRVLRWSSAYNEFMAARVDFMKAAAAFFMKRKIKGTPNQLVKIASKALSRSSDLASAQAMLPEGVNAPPQRSASILNENENLSHEPLKIDSGAAAAADDARLLRAQFSAATRWPQHYIGDAETANLATATSMELPVLKSCESRQELFEGLFRWAFDRAIEKAVENNKLPTKLEGQELQEAKRKMRKHPDGYAWVTDADGDLGIAKIRQWRDLETREWRVEIVEAYEDQAQDEKDTDRELGYEFAMPAVLKRLAPDVVNSWAMTARTFDPNNTNVELSRIALSAIFADAFEMEDAKDLVDRVFPEGYVDPAIAAAQAAAGGGNMFGPQYEPGMNPEQQNGQVPPEGTGSPGQQFGGGNTIYGAKGGPRPPEQIQQAEIHTNGREGEVVEWPGRDRVAHQDRQPVKTAANGRKSTVDEDYRDEVLQPTLDALTELDADSADRG